MIKGSENSISTSTSNRNNNEGSLRALFESPIGVNPAELYVDLDSIFEQLEADEIIDGYPGFEHDGFKDWFGKFTSSNSKLRGVVRIGSNVTGFLTKVAKFAQGYTGKGARFFGVDYPTIVRTVETFDESLRKFADQYAPSHGEHKDISDVHDSEYALTTYNTSIARTLESMMKDKGVGNAFSGSVEVDLGRLLDVLERACWVLMATTRYNLEAQSDVLGSTLNMSNYHVVPSIAYAQEVAKCIPPTVYDKAYDSMLQYGHGLGLRVERLGRSDESRMISLPTLLTDTVNNARLGGTTFSRMRTNAELLQETEKLAPLDFMLQPLNEMSPTLYPWLPSEASSSIDYVLRTQNCRRNMFKNDSFYRYWKHQVDGIASNDTAFSPGKYLSTFVPLTWSVPDNLNLSDGSVSLWVTVDFTGYAELSVGAAGTSRTLTGAIFYGKKNAAGVVELAIRESSDSETIEIQARAPATKGRFSVSGTVSIELSRVERQGIVSTSTYFGGAGDIVIGMLIDNKTDLEGSRMYLQDVNVHLHARGEHVPIIVERGYESKTLYDCIGRLSGIGRHNPFPLSLQSIWNKYITLIMAHFDMTILTGLDFHIRFPMICAKFVEINKRHELRRDNNVTTQVDDVTVVGRYIHYLISGVERWHVSDPINPLHTVQTVELRPMVALAVINIVKSLSCHTIYRTKPADTRARVMAEWNMFFRGA